MQYYRCKCGNSTSFGSMSAPRCIGCKKCHTAVSWYPKDVYEKPAPHNFYDSKVETNEGPKLLTRCSWCGLTKREIEEQEK